jgi:predicted PurR-regulated permease PerM
MLAVDAVVFGLDMFAVNVLFPKVIGKRLQLNPLVVTIALLVWGWLWGAMRLILAIPITGAMKIIFDHVESLCPFGRWLEE